MATWRQALEVVMTDEDVARLLTVSRSRTEPASRVQRAQMLLAYRENPSFCAVGQRVGAHHQTVQRCVERALGYGPLAAIEDRPRPGKEQARNLTTVRRDQRRARLRPGSRLCSAVRIGPAGGQARIQ